ncbi:hypothetical protein A5893_14235 [Pedobacter psychrophilus]|uniref:Outer membrane lipoprotein-sorting protein n=1 Tax=Pedobacter psychrophilus TaxID=1826909 RepID=A0A179DC03_9SPHI|nr:DUF6503 family protein [Pedobacter psychrophilus]OAQ38571.1 hypothetical protein A5893_14235 [Pedobacter psychrophilus]
MRKTTLLFAFFFAIVFSLSAQNLPNKDVVLEKVWKAVGGKSAFEKSRYLEFTFAPIRQGNQSAGRHHIWDRYTGDYRFESTADNGTKTVVLFNVNNKKGKAYENGNLLPDSTSNKIINRAYAAYINDSYWLMSPLKLQDEGVNTQLEDNQEINNQTCNVIHLNFDKVGLTPGDQYWMYVNEKTGEIIQWKFLLQNQKNSSIFEWEPYQDLGNGLKLSVKKTNKESSTSIYFPVAKVLQKVDNNIFTKP